MWTSWLRSSESVLTLGRGDLLRGRFLDVIKSLRGGIFLAIIHPLVYQKSESPLFGYLWRRLVMATCAMNGKRFQRFDLLHL
jgi:hypothetical protein